MTNSMILAAAVPIGLLAICMPASAHHSFAMFDQTKVSELKSVAVVKFQWANPHVYVVIQSGGVAYTLECGSPANMSQAGWKFRSIKPGDMINVSYFPLRNGKPGGALKTATLPDGRTLSAW